MISYPGKILDRFGRYEAVESLGRSGRALLWRAWDPFLERFVVVASLPDLDPAELHRGLRSLDDALSGWIGEKYGKVKQVLDFGPDGAEAPPFFVLAAPDDATPVARVRTPPRPPVPLPPAEVRRKRGPIIALVGAAIVALVVIGWVVLRPRPVPPNPATAAPPEQVAAAAPPTVPLPPTRQLPPSPPPTAEAPRTEAPRAEPPRAEPAAAAPSPAPPRLVHVMPPPGVVPVVTGEGVDFAVEADAGGAVAYTWELDGTRVGSGPRYRFQTDFLARVGEHTLALKASDPVSGASVGEHWVLTLDGRNSEPEVTIARPGHDVAAGQALVLQATVRDPDTPRGDKVGCAWTVNGAAATGDCQRLNWKVPAGVPTGQIVAALTVKDLRGAAVTRTISVPVRGLGPPPVAVARAATPTRPVPAPPRAAATVSPATGARATSAPVPPAPVPPARAPAAVAAHADDDEVQVRAAIDGEARRYESLVRGRGGRVTDYKVLAITRDGNRAEVKITRTVELPAQRPQVAEKELIVRKHDGVWSVGE